MKALVLLAVLGASTVLSAQEPPNPQKLYEAGSYDQALEAIASQGDGVSPASIYLAGQSHLRMNRHDEARAQFAKLSAVLDSPEPWSLIGESAVALVDGQNPVAVEKAMAAVAMAPDHFHAHYQLGLAHSASDQWEPAAAAFAKAAEIDPAFAYAHYYAGLAYSRLRQVDRMATHLEHFLTAAPDAPERAAVTSLMRSVRGR